MAYATVTDIEDRWRPLTAQETTNATTWLEDAAVIIRRSVPTIATLILDEDYAATVLSINAEMVLRRLKNPEGYRQVSLGDAAYTRDTALSSGALYLTKDEAAQLGALTGGARAFTITLHDEDTIDAYDPWLVL